MWSLRAPDPRSWAPARRDTIAGAIVLFVAINLTLLPFLWGHSSLEDSEYISSIYSTGSRFPSVEGPNVLRVLDPGAPAWQTEPEFALERWEIVHEKTPPLWNPYSAYGAPLAANMQSQPYSPFAWLRFVWPSPRGYSFFVMLRLFVAGLGAFLFLRQFVGLVPSLVGGVSYMYAGYLWLYVTMPEVSSEVWLPTVLFAFERLLRRPGPGTAAFLSLALAAVVVGGMPEAALLIFVVAYAYAAIRSAGDAAVRERIAGVTAATFGATVLAAGLTAVLTLPFAQYVAVSWNAHVGAADAFGNAVDGFSGAALAQYLAPLLYGGPNNALFTSFSGWSGIRGYFGAAPAFFAFVAIFAELEAGIRRRSRPLPVAFFACAAAFFLAKRFGIAGVSWIGSLPGFRLVNFPKYEENIVALCVAVLAAFGVAALAERRVSGIATWLAALVPLTILTGVSIADRSALTSLGSHADFYTNAMRGSLVALGLAGACAVLLKSGLKPRSFALAALFVVIAESNANFIVPLYYVVNGRAPQSATAQAGAPVVSFLREHLRDGGRFFAEDAILYPNWSAAFQIADIRSLDALYDERYLPFVRRFIAQGSGEELSTRFVGTDRTDLQTPLHRRFLQLSSVAYVGTEHPLSGVFEGAFAGSALAPDPTLHTGFFSIAGTTKAGLFMHPPRRRFAVEVTVPQRHPMLDASIGLMDGAWSEPVCGDGVVFTMEAEDAGRIVTLFRRYIDPKHRAFERAWLDRSVSLAPYAGRRLRLLLSTAGGPSGTTCNDWAVWSEPRIRGSSDARSPQFALAYAEPGATLYRFRDPLPRLAIYERALAAHDRESARLAIASRSFDPQREAVVEDGGFDLGRLAAAAGKLVRAGRIDDYRPAYVRATVDARAPSIVVLNDTYFPGWTARVDGRTVPILRANFLFRGVLVGAGHHVLEFAYVPESFETGSAISLASAAVLGMLTFVAGRRRRTAVGNVGPLD